MCNIRKCHRSVVARNASPGILPRKNAKLCPHRHVLSVSVHSTVFLLSAIMGLFSHADLSDCVNPGHTLPHQDFNLP
jgi:hypothetical protein